MHVEAVAFHGELGLTRPLFGSAVLVVLRAVTRPMAKRQSKGGERSTGERLGRQQNAPSRLSVPLPFTLKWRTKLAVRSRRRSRSEAGRRRIGAGALVDGLARAPAARDPLHGRGPPMDRGGDRRPRERAGARGHRGLHRDEAALPLPGRRVPPVARRRVSVDIGAAARRNAAVVLDQATAAAALSSGSSGMLSCSTLRGDGAGRVLDGSPVSGASQLEGSARPLLFFAPSIDGSAFS